MGDERYKVLVVDDSAVQLELLTGALTASGFEAHGVASVFDVMHQFEVLRPDVVVLDVLMPALNGDRVLELIRKNADRPCPVVLYSSLPHDELAHRARAAGAEAFVQKGRNTQPLIIAVQQLMKGKRGW